MSQTSVTHSAAGRMPNSSPQAASQSTGRPFDAGGKRRGERLASSPSHPSPWCKRHSSTDKPDVAKAFVNTDWPAPVDAESLSPLQHASGQIGTGGVLDSSIVGNSKSRATSFDIATATCSQTSSMDSLDHGHDLQTVAGVVNAWRNILHGTVSAFLSAMDKPSLRVGRGLVIFASAIYGTNFATVKMLDEAVPMEVSAALRFTLAAAVVSAAVLAKESDVSNNQALAKERLNGLLAGMEIGFWYFLGYACQALCLQTVAAGKSAFFNSLAVVVVPLLDAGIKKKLLKQQDVAAVILASLGVGMLELGPTGLSVSVGDLFAFGQMMFFGVGYWRLEAVSQQYPTQSGRVTMGQLVGVAVGSIMTAVATQLNGPAFTFNRWLSWFSDPFIVGSLLWTGLISTALALYLETVALKIVSASELTLIMTSVSLWGAAFAYVTMGETLSLTGFAGGLLILTGCLMGNMTPKMKKGDEYTEDVVENL